MQNNNAKQSGYTLMEMVVAVAVFVIIITAIIGVFIAILRVQRKTAAMQAVQQDARWAMETMARYARMDKIDYENYGTGKTCENDFYGGNGLCLENHIFEWDETVLKMDGNPITPEGIEVEDLKFYVAPSNSPYVSGGPNEQSRVTIIMKTRSTEGREEEIMTLQTTVSTRAYTR